MEVSSRPLPRAARLTRLAALPRLGSALALAAVLAVALGVAGSQPLRSPWWMYADADASYVASSANLMGGKPTIYLDHPGFPLQDLMAITFEARYLAGRVLHGTPAGALAYARARMLQLDDSRPYYRTYAVLFYLLGAAISFLVLTRAFGSALWGLAGGLLWIGAPGLVVMSIQYRPDVLLAGLTLLVGGLIVFAAERRGPWLYLLAALWLGFAFTVKIHAAALLLPFGIALAWRPPAAGWRARLTERMRAGLRRFRLPLGVGAALWLALIVAFDHGSFPPSPTSAERVILVGAPALFLAYVALSAAAYRWTSSRLVRGPLDPFHGVLLVAFALGVVLPASLFPRDGLQMLVNMSNGLIGRGVNQGVAPFTLSFAEFLHWPLQQAAVVFLLAGVGALVGLRRRDLWPLLWFSGASLAAVMAMARLGTVHYFAPAYVLSVPPALWLLRRRGALVAGIAAALLVAYVVGPQLQHAGDAAGGAAYNERKAAALETMASRVLALGQVALVDIDAPTPDTRYNGLVEHFVVEAPPYPGRRFLEDYPRSLDTAKAEGLRFAYYVGSRGDIAGPTRMQFSVGTFEAVPKPALSVPAYNLWTVALHGAGADRPYDHPDAVYDPWTGFYKDPKGLYWDFAGHQVVNPTRRKYVPRLHLWLDQFGDYWNAQGVRVMSNPKLRTAR